MYSLSCRLNASFHFVNYFISCSKDDEMHKVTVHCQESIKCPDEQIVCTAGHSVCIWVVLPPSDSGSVKGEKLKAHFMRKLKTEGPINVWSK